jgi:hypothetical protein
MASKLIRRLLVVVGLLALVPVNGLCSALPLSTLLLGASITVDHLTFSSFQLYDPGSIVDTADTTVWGSLAGSSVPLLITYRSDGSGTPVYVSGGSGTVGISYDVQADPGWQIPTIAGEAIGGRWSSTYDSVMVIKNYCVGGDFSDAGSPYSCSTGYENQGPVFVPYGALITDQDPTEVFGPAVPLGPSVTTLGVIDAVMLSGYADGAQIDQIINTLTEQEIGGGGIPEPATLLLIGSALLGLGALRRKSA